MSTQIVPVPMPAGTCEGVFYNIAARDYKCISDQEYAVIQKERKEEEIAFQKQGDFISNVLLIIVAVYIIFLITIYSYDKYFNSRPKA